MDNGIVSDMCTGTKLRPSTGAGMSAGIDKEEEGIETESWELRNETEGGEYDEDEPVSRIPRLSDTCLYYFSDRAYSIYVHSRLMIQLSIQNLKREHQRQITHYRNLLVRAQSASALASMSCICSCRSCRGGIRR
jgi:hypothetical protein